jgi:hypothetical protein
VNTQHLSALSTKDLKKLHDSLYRAIWLMLQLLEQNDVPAPSWSPEVQAYIQAIYAELWNRTTQVATAKQAE